MTTTIDRTDVPQVSAQDLFMPMRVLIQKGRGLALLRGLSEDELRALENEIWAHFSSDFETRVAVALRFRALVDVFASRRLKDLLLQHGFKTIARAISEAASQRLNTRFGFSPQRFVTALDRARPVRRLAEPEGTRLAA